MKDALPARADVVIIGGGIAGCSLAWHLTMAGVTNVVLLERKQLACGTTWHSVGSVGQVRSSLLHTLLASHTARMLPKLEEETGMMTGYKHYGSIMIALNEERVEEMRRAVTAAHAYGHEASMLSVDEIRERCAIVRTDDVVAGMLLPGDGRTNPVDTVQALARAARNRGAMIFEDVLVDDIVVEDGCAVGVRTSRGDIAAEKVAICAGMWSRELAGKIGVHVPLLAAEHFYAVTEPIPDLGRDMPMVRVPDERTYYKEDTGKLLLGCFEQKAKPWGYDGIPDDFCFDSLPDDFDHFAPILETAIQRMPLLEDAGIQLFFNGPESFTPDGEFHLGEAAEVRNLYVSCGFNSVGVMCSGGVAHLLCEIMTTGRPSWDVSSFDLRRNMQFQTNVTYLRERISESLGMLYGMQWPRQQYASARGLRRSPLHDHLKSRGAVMECIAGWERAETFARDGEDPRIEHTYFKPNWHRWCALECAAATGDLAIFDATATSKLMLAGTDAEAVAARLFTRTPDLEGATRSLALNERGGIEAIVQLVRLANDQMLVLSRPGDQVRLLAWLRHHIGPSDNCTVIDTTSAYAVIDLFGPRASAVVNVSATNGASASNVDVGQVTAIHCPEPEHGLDCIRLLVSSEMSPYVYEHLTSAPVLACDMGWRALEAMRLEEGRLCWGVEIDANTDPFAARLHYLVDDDGGGRFIGRDACTKLAGRPAGESCFVQVALVSPEPMLIGREAVLLDGEPVGWVVSGAFSHTRDRAVGIATIEGKAALAAVEAGRDDFEIEIALRRVGCRVNALKA